MKILSLPKPAPAGARRARWAQAFTLAEMMVAVFIFVFMILGIIYTWMFGMRYDEVVCSKLGASDKSRMSFDLLTGDIRSAKWWKVGTGNKTSFNQCTNQMDQAGNAIKLSSSGDTNSAAYVIYYFDTNACQLCRRSNGVAQVQIIAQNLTNSGTLGNGNTNTSMTFQAQKYDGTLAQDWQYKYMIVTTMEFCQYQYPLTKVGPGYYYNYYRIQLKAASHCPN
jgi:Tfp pilus assembly protein PilW